MSGGLVLITGGTGKLGRLLVADRLARGDSVIATGKRAKSRAALAAAHAEATAAGKLTVLAADLAAEKGVARLVAELAASDLRPTGLVNNARNLDFLALDKDGSVPRRNFLGELTVDVVAPYELTMALASAARSALARVVNIGSQYGVVAANQTLYAATGGQSPIHYGVAKAALVHLTRELAVRLAGRSVQVNCVSFGGVEGRADAAFQAAYGALCPSGRMLREDEVAGTVAFLLSPDCAGMTGHNLIVDGGWTLW